MNNPNQRQIKFRIWDTRKNKMIYPKKMQMLSPSIVTFDLDNDTYISADLNDPGRFEMEQFIGIKDSEGKDVYEGDLYKVQNGDVCVIVYEDTMFKAKTKYHPPVNKFKEPNNWYFDTYDYFEGGKVIDNIHECKHFWEIYESRATNVLSNKVTVKMRCVQCGKEKMETKQYYYDNVKKETMFK